MYKNELKGITNNEIEEKISQTRREIFDLQFKQSTQKNTKPHFIKDKKHLLAQLLTTQTKLSKH